jgi:hypothetical protein
MSRTAEKIVCRASWRDPNSCQFLGSEFFNSLLNADIHVILGAHH